MGPAPTTVPASGSKKCPAGRQCPNLRRADVLDKWITTVAAERNGYREAIREHLTRCDSPGLRAALPKGCQ